MSNVKLTVQEELLHLEVADGLTVSGGDTRYDSAPGMTRLGGAVTAGVTTSVALRTTPESALRGRGEWRIIDAYTTDAELAEIDGDGKAAPVGGGAFANTHGVGALVVPVPDRVLNVRLFGAKGDGTTDDTAAIQAAANALSAAGGGRLRVADGVYIIGSKGDGVHDGIRLYSNSVFEIAAGASLKMKDAANLDQIIYIYNATNVAVTGRGGLGEIDGNKANQTGVYEKGIQVDGCAGVLISDLYIHDLAGTTVTTEEGAGINIRADAEMDADAIVSRCIVEDVDGYGIGTFRVDNVLIDTVIVKGCSNHGISLSSDTTTSRMNQIHNALVMENGNSGINLEHQRDVVISGVTSYLNDGLHGAIRIQDGGRIVIQGLVSRADRKAIVCGVHLTAAPREVIISDFVISDSIHSAIEFQTGGLAAGSIESVQISNGHIISCGDNAGAADYHGIDIKASVESAHIHNVIIYDSGAYGVISAASRLEMAGVEVQASGNDGIYHYGGAVQIANCRAALNGRHGIYLSGSSIRGAVSGCTVEGNQRTGIRINGVTDKDGLAISGCHVINNGQETADTYVGIELNDSFNIAVVGCVCNDDQVTPTQKIGIFEAGTSDYNNISANIARGNATGQINTSGLNTVTSGANVV